MAKGQITARRDGSFLWLVIDNPGRLNAMSAAMGEQLYDALDQCESDPEIRVVLLTGAGEKAFMSGGDLSEFDEARSTSERMLHTLERGERTVRKLRHLGKPTIAVIRGWCVGGGMNMALNCDLRICADDARFFHPAARHAQGFAYDFTAQMVRTLGVSVTREILMTCRRFDSAEAHRLGLVHQVAPVDRFDEFVREYAGAVAENGPLALLSCKRTIEQALADPADRDLELVKTLYVACADSQDYQEGARAFEARRKPVYKGV